MNPKSLQHGGTFCNVLSRKFDAIIVPLFRKIIAYIDQNCNLNLINPSNKEPQLSQFWLNMFSTVVKFSYQDMVVQKEEVTGIASRMAVHAFECILPFSWLINEAIESQWDNISGTIIIIALVGLNSPCDLFGHHLVSFQQPVECKFNHGPKYLRGFLL